MPTQTIEPYDHAGELDQHVREAADLLGWRDGTVLGPRIVAGRRVALVAQLVPDVHDYRTGSGWPPILDRVDLEWLMPHQRGGMPDPAVEVLGVIATSRHWATARANATPFADLAPSVVMLPRHVAASLHIPSWGQRLGVVAVNEHGAVDVMREPSRPSPNLGLATYRWVLEFAYHLLMTQGGDR